MACHDSWRSFSVSLSHARALHLPVACLQLLAGFIGPSFGVSFYRRVYTRFHPSSRSLSSSSLSLLFALRLCLRSYSARLPFFLTSLFARSLSLAPSATAAVVFLSPTRAVFTPGETDDRLVQERSTTCHDRVFGLACTSRGSVIGVRERERRQPTDRARRRPSVARGERRREEGEQ